MADKIDIPSFQIAASKMRADGNAYFKLFEKHVPRNLDMNNVVLLYKLDNLSCICKIINMNSKAHYVIVSNDAVNTALQVVLDKSIDVEYIKEFDFKETDMKFDCIIMNPPYSRNLHLKILAEAIKHLKDDGTCVNLSPCDYLTDIGKYVGWNKNNEIDNIWPYIESLNTVGHRQSNDMFSLGNQIGDLGIYVCSLKEHNILKFPISKEARVIATKLYKSKSLWSKYVRKECKCKYFVNMYKWHLDNTDHVKCFLAPSDGRNSYGIVFSTEAEKNNFISSIHRWPYKFMWSYGDINPAHLPFLGDSINPRTGLKGYTSEWTDDDFYKFFNITLEDQKIIEETMEKYAAK